MWSSFQLGRLACRQPVCLDGQASGWPVCLIGWLVVSLWAACQLGRLASDRAVFLVNWLVRLSARMARFTGRGSQGEARLVYIACSCHVGQKAMAPATCMLRVCTYACTVIDVCFSCCMGFCLSIRTRMADWRWGCLPGRLAGPWAVCLDGWLVVRLSA